MLTHLAPRNIENCVFEVPGSPPVWIWVSTCPDQKCDCRDLHILASDHGRQALLEQLSSIRKSLQIDRRFKDRTPPMGHLLAFNLDLDTAAAYFITNSRETVDLSDDPQIGPIANRIDGELLDQIDKLWHLGKGLPTPEQRLLTAKEIAIDGWQLGDLIAWNDLCPSARRDIYILDHDKYEAVELYCPVPDCTCGEVLVHFQTPVRNGPPDPGSVVVKSSGLVTLQPDQSRRALLEQLWTAFQTRHPRYTERFTGRYALVRSAGARFATHLEAPARTIKFGRNDPCPCGSNKKYKRCCGAN